MNLQDIVDQLDLNPYTQGKPLNTIEPSGGYTSDLLSCVMAGAKQGNIWITLQAHVNIVAVAALLDLSAVVITEGAQPDTATIERALEQNITLLGTNQPSYLVAGKLWEMGLKSG